MKAADSDKDSKSSELTTGPSCIQFRLIIVKVEKFSKRRIESSSRDIPLFLARHYTWLTAERTSTLFSSSTSRVPFPHSFLRIPDCRTILSRVYDFRLHCVHHKGKFSPFCSNDTPEDGGTSFTLSFSQKQSRSLRYEKNV